MRTSYNVEIASLFRNSRLGIASFPLCSFLLYCSISAVFFFSKFVPVFPTFGGKFVRRKKVLKISWFSALIRGLTSVVTWYFAYVLRDNTRLCKHFSLRSHNKNGISSKGGLPAETTKQDFDLLHFAMSAVNLNYRKPLLYVYAQDNQRCHETYSKANTAKLVSDLKNNLYFVRKA